MLWEMYCVVKGQGRTANTFHELLNEQTWKGKSLRGLVGGLDVDVPQFQANYREESTYDLHRKHTECDTHCLHLMASVSLGAASVLMLSIILQDAVLQNHILFCLSV